MTQILNMKVIGLWLIFKKSANFGTHYRTPLQKVKIKWNHPNKLHVTIAQLFHQLNLCMYVMYINLPCTCHVPYFQVVTVNNKNRVLESCHSQGEKHLDKDKTLGEVSKQYYWPKMLEDVEEFCQSCEQCQKANRLYTCTAWYTNMHKNIDTDYCTISGMCTGW